MIKKRNQMQYLFKNTVGLLLLFIVVGIAYHTKGEKMEVNYDYAIDMANEFLKEKDFNIEEVDVVYDPDCQNWKKLYLNDKRFVEHHTQLLKLLENKHYWAIQYIPKRMSGYIVKGGGAWVFINKEDGEVITYFFEK